MKSFACLICAGLIGLPWVEQAGKRLQGELHQNLSCTAATYAALDSDATEADFERAEALCPGTG